PEFQRPDKDDPKERFVLEVNAHPPTSVLLALPLADLDYPDAVLAWNLFSLALLVPALWLVIRQLDLRVAPWMLLPLAAVLLICSPFRQQVVQGQLNLVLLAILTGAWAADRSGRPWWAGTLVGLATALKLFPGFLFLYFVLRRRWHALGAGIVSLSVCTGLTATVLGVEAFESYARDVLPQIGRFRSDWVNASL